MQVIGDKVLVEIFEAKETTASGIIIPNKLQKKNEGKVLLVGDKVKHIKEGDTVRYYPHCGTPITYNGKECLFLKEEGEIELILG